MSAPVPTPPSTFRAFLDAVNPTREDFKRLPNPVELGPESAPVRGTVIGAEPPVRGGSSRSDCGDFTLRGHSSPPVGAGSHPASPIVGAAGGGSPSGSPSAPFPAPRAEHPTLTQARRELKALFVISALTVVIAVETVALAYAVVRLLGVS